MFLVCILVHPPKRTSQLVTGAKIMNIATLSLFHLIWLESRTSLTVSLFFQNRIAAATKEKVNGYFYQHFYIVWRLFICREDKSRQVTMKYNCKEAR